ncbi:MAG: PorP/SprF family type IX secretion system membrane protein [Chitinophagales bacterium]
MMRRILFLITVLSTLMAVQAQDIHFSQYYASPLTLNPANTGMVNGDFRATVNYRGQWFTLPVTNSIATYNTYQASFDMDVLRKKRIGTGLGIGAMFYADEAGNGSLATYSGMANLAVHQTVDRYQRSRISLGFQVGFVQKRIFEHDLLFEEQFDAGLNSFNPFLDNGEDGFNEGKFTYLDVNIGGMFTSKATDNFAYYLGFATNHVNRPGESFLGSGNKLDMRYTFHGGARIQFKNNEQFRMLPTVLYMMQTNAQQFNIGSGFEYEFSDNFTGFAGVFDRVVGDVNGFENDAVILTVGAETYNVRIGASYDMNTSSLKNATNTSGGFELSVIYIHNKQDEKSRSRYGFCPTF